MTGLDRVDSGSIDVVSEADSAWPWNEQLAASGNDPIEVAVTRQFDEMLLRDERMQRFVSEQISNNMLREMIRLGLI